MLDGARNWPWSPRRKSLWWRFRRWLMGPWKPRYVIAADPAEVFGELALRMTEDASRRLGEQIWTGVCDTPRREPNHSPAWAYVLVTLVIGLVTGMLGYWLQNR